MKKIIPFMISAALLSSCYEPYVKDYDYSAVYTAYQYDLRSFVVGEGMQFRMGVQLGGVIDNTTDRVVSFNMDDNLVTGDLSQFTGTDPFTAYDVLSGASASGTVSQAYVSTSVKSAGITAFTPLPKDYYSLSSDSRMVIASGMHSATVTVKADSLKLLADSNVSNNPYYAIAFRITSADADTVLKDKSFEVIALRIENKFFGNWYHAGKTVVRDDMSARVISESYESGLVPQDDNKVYALTTAGPNSVVTNRLGNKSGSLKLDFNGDDVTVSCADNSGKEIKPFGESYANGAKLLQDRKIFLNYKYSNGDGTTTYVHDTLSFRNRTRDGINEWQDSDPSHYVK